MNYPIEYYRSGFFRKWRARITASNGKIIFASSQGYFNRSECEENVELIARCVGAYNKSDLVSFGEYLLSDVRETDVVSHPEFEPHTIKERLSQVSHADLENWTIKN